jgi:hypothetical protein
VRVADAEAERGLAVGPGRDYSSGKVQRFALRKQRPGVERCRAPCGPTASGRPRVCADAWGPAGGSSGWNPWSPRRRPQKALAHRAGNTTAHLLRCGRRQPPAPNSPARQDDRSGAGQLAVPADLDVRQADLAHVITVKPAGRVTIWRPPPAGTAGSARIRAATPQAAMPGSRPSALPSRRDVDGAALLVEASRRQSPAPAATNVTSPTGSSPRQARPTGAQLPRCGPAGLPGQSAGACRRPTAPRRNARFGQAGRAKATDQGKRPRASQASAAFASGRGSRLSRSCAGRN